MQNLVSVLGAAVSVAALLTVMVFGGHPAMAQPSYYEVPDVPTDRIRFIGNGAGSGAKMALLNAGLRDAAERISKEARYIELAGRPDFQTTFMESMLFLPVTT